MNKAEVDTSSNTSILTGYTSYFTEVLRIAPFFRNSAEQWSQLIDKKQIMFEFLYRIGDEGTTCNKRQEIDPELMLAEIKNSAPDENRRHVSFLD